MTGGAQHLPNSNTTGQVSPTDRSYTKQVDPVLQIADPLTGPRDDLSTENSNTIRRVDNNHPARIYHLKPQPGTTPHPTRGPADWQSTFLWQPVFDDVVVAPYQPPFQGSFRPDKDILFLDTFFLETYLHAPPKTHADPVEWAIPFLPREDIERKKIKIIAVSAEPFRKPDRDDNYNDDDDDDDDDNNNKKKNNNDDEDDDNVINLDVDVNINVNKDEKDQEDMNKTDEAKTEEQWRWQWWWRRRRERERERERERQRRNRQQHQHYRQHRPEETRRLRRRALCRLLVALFPALERIFLVEMARVPRLDDNSNDNHHHHQDKENIVEPNTKTEFARWGKFEDAVIAEKKAWRRGRWRRTATTNITTTAAAAINQNTHHDDDSCSQPLSRSGIEWGLILPTDPGPTDKPVLIRLIEEDLVRARAEIPMIQKWREEREREREDPTGRLVHQRRLFHRKFGGLSRDNSSRSSRMRRLLLIPTSREGAPPEPAHVSAPPTRAEPVIMLYFQDKFDAARNAGWEPGETVDVAHLTLR